jgi:hypothetical protein
MEGKIHWNKTGLLRRLCFVFHGKLPGEEKCIKQSFQKVSVLLKHLWTMICVGDLSETEIGMIVSKWNDQSHQFLISFCSKNVVATMELNGDGLAAFYVNDWVGNIFERLPPTFPGINSFKESLGLIRTSVCSNFGGTKPDDIFRLSQYLRDWCSAQSSQPKPAAMLFHIPPLSDGYVLQRDDNILRQLKSFISLKGFPVSSNPLRRRRPHSDHGPRSDHDTLAEVNYYSCFF